MTLTVYAAQNDKRDGSKAGNKVYQDRTKS